MRGLFITFEGPEGCGKSTHSALVAERLRARGGRVVQVREPGGTRIGEALRDIVQHDVVDEEVAPQTEALLFAASRAQLVQRVILPALEAGSHVLCDRFCDSTTVYQGHARGLGVAAMVELNAFAVDGAIPDLTVLLDVSVSEGAERVQARNAAKGVQSDRFEREPRAFHERVREGFLMLAKRWPERFRVIDASRETDTVAGDVWSAVSPLLDRGNTGDDA